MLEKLNKRKDANLKKQNRVDLNNRKESNSQDNENASGQITVFLALLFFLLLGVAFLTFEGIREYLMVSLIEENFDKAGEDILANYDKILWERYHLFFLDPREEAYLVQDATDRMNEAFNEKSGFFHDLHSEITLDHTYSAVQDGGKALRKQIKEWEICQGVYKLPQMINQLLKSTEKKDDMSRELLECEKEEQRIDSLEVPNKNENTGIEEKYERNDRNKNGIQEETGEQRRIRDKWKEWKDTLGSIFENGILYYVAEDMGSLSNLQLMDTSSLPSKNMRGKRFLFDSKGLSFTKLSQLKNICEKGFSVEKNSKLLSSDLYLFPYIFECYTRYGSSDDKKEHCLKYEIEYLIGGSKKDKANLKSIADQIFLLRFFVNYSYAIKDANIRTEASSMALALTGIFGFPEGKEIVTQLLIASLCYGESLLEVRALFKGKKVAVIKSKVNWNLSFSNAVMKLKNREDIIKVKSGVDYDNFLMCLIILRLESNYLLYRMMDIMQCNVALEEPGFLMERSLSSFEWTGRFSWNPWIRSIPLFHIIKKDPFSMERNQNVFYR